jgi:hypothetical protein
LLRYLQLAAAHFAATPAQSSKLDGRDGHDLKARNEYIGPALPPIARMEQSTLRLLAGCPTARPPRCRRTRDELASPHIGFQAQTTALHPLKQVL